MLVQKGYPDGYNNNNSSKHGHLGIQYIYGKYILYNTKLCVIKQTIYIE